MRKGTLNTDYSIQQLEKEFKRTILKRKHWSALSRAISYLIVLSALAVLLTTFWFPVYSISGDSMEPTLERGMIVVARYMDDYSRGDIIAAHYGNQILIRRLIGMPEDTVQIDAQGVVSINGVPIQENYLTELLPGKTDLTYPFRVPENGYFVLGDNRKASVDSRVSDVGCIEEKAIAGKILFCLWPLRQIGYVD